MCSPIILHMFILYKANAAIPVQIHLMIEIGTNYPNRYGSDSSGVYRVKNQFLKCTFKMISP